MSTSSRQPPDRKSTRLNSSHGYISYAVFCSTTKNGTAESTCPPHRRALSVSSLRVRRPPGPPLFPYTTLFRSYASRGAVTEHERVACSAGAGGLVAASTSTRAGPDGVGTWRSDEHVKPPAPRSEEHTSELQSRLHLVCRLLLHNKKRHGRIYLPAAPPRSVRFFATGTPPPGPSALSLHDALPILRLPRRRDRARACRLLRRRGRTGRRIHQRPCRPRRRGHLAVR